MLKWSAIQPIKKIYYKNTSKLPEKSGVYAFWWIGSRSELIEKSNRKILLKGPGGKYVKVMYEDWWPDELPYPCLYVGKTTNIKSRISQHIMRGSKGRIHEPDPDRKKVRPKTTSCQLRFGIEHIFPDEINPLEKIENFVGLSYRTNFKNQNKQNSKDFFNNEIAERFYEEDRLIGSWRPWFNIDSER